MKINRTNYTIFTNIGILMGILNAFAWIFGSLNFRIFDSNNFIWWMLFCIVLNMGVSLAIAQKHTWRFQRLFWVIGIALIVIIFSAIIVSFWASYGVKDWGVVSFVFGAIQGGLIGLIIGCILGIKTLPNDMSALNIVQKIIVKSATGIVIGLSISIVLSSSLLAVIWITKFTDGTYYHPLDLDIITIIMLSLLGVIPSAITGLTTTLAIHITNWWLNRKMIVSKNSRG